MPDKIISLFDAVQTEDGRHGIVMKITANRFGLQFVNNGPLHYYKRVYPLTRKQLDSGPLAGVGCNLPKK